MDSRIWVINPSNICGGFAAVTPRWMPVIAGATPAQFADQLMLLDEAIEPIDYHEIRSADLVALSIHTLNARRAYEKIKRIKETSGATIIAGGIHATLFPEEVLDHGADAVVTGDGDLVWADAVNDFFNGSLQRLYCGGRIRGQDFVSTPRWDLMKHERYLMASVHTTRGCPENCSFCSVWVTDGRRMRIRPTDDIVREINTLCSLGFRFFILADDNFYAVGKKNYKAYQDIMEQRYELMEKLATDVPSAAKFFTQTTLRTADDPEFLKAMEKARIRGALIGIESVDHDGLQSIEKEFNKTGQDLIDAIARMQAHQVYVLGSFIVGLEPDTKETFETMARIANASHMAFAQFVKYTPFPGTVDWFHMINDKLPIKLAPGMEQYWLLEKVGLPSRHPRLQPEEIQNALRLLWDRFYSTPQIMKRARRIGLTRPSPFLAYVLISKIFKKMYFRHGITADSARTVEADRLTRLLGNWALRLFKAQVQPNSPRPAEATGALM